MVVWKVQARTGGGANAQGKGYQGKHENFEELL